MRGMCWPICLHRTSNQITTSTGSANSDTTGRSVQERVLCEGSIVPIMLVCVGLILQLYDSVEGVSVSAGVSACVCVRVCVCGNFHTYMCKCLACACAYCVHIYVHVCL